MEKKYEIKVNELRKVTCKEKLKQRWERVRGKRNIEGLRRQSWMWERKYVGRGEIGKGGGRGGFG